MAVAEEVKEAVLRQWENSRRLETPPSLRAFAKSVGQSENTVRRWVQKAQETQTEAAVNVVTLTPVAILSNEERQAQLAADCLREAQIIVQNLSAGTAKERLDSANAAAKLIEKYQALVGQPEHRTEVTHLGNWTNETLDELLDDMGYVGPPVEELVGLTDDEVQTGAEDLGPVDGRPPYVSLGDSGEI